jgi:CheY-like chemotaxis protein
MAKTILLADDSLTIQKVVELTFMDQDYAVVAVGDGGAALARWADSRPDLVIADVHMPGADGYEVCRQVKRSRPGTPVLLLVGTFETFDEAQAQACGANGHLKKPFDSQELFRLVERLIAENPARPAPAPAPVFEAPAPVFEAPAPVFEAPAAFAPAAAPAFAPAPVFAPPAPVPAAPLPAAPEFAFSMAPEPIAPLYEPAAYEPAAYEPATYEPASFAPAPFEAAAYPPAASFEPPAAAAAAPVAAAPIAPAPVALPPLAAPSADFSLSAADVDRIARRVVELIGERAIKDIAWEVVPDLAEVVIKERLRELESQVQ